MFLSTVSFLTVVEHEGNTEPGPAELMHVATVVCSAASTGKLSPDLSML